jgi:hypothetical protein
MLPIILHLKKYRQQPPDNLFSFSPTSFVTTDFSFERG